MNRFATLSAAVVVGSSQALGQAASEDVSPPTPAPAPPVLPEPATTEPTPVDDQATTDDEQERAWRFAATSYIYVIPDDSDYVAATFTADRGWLHLEGRYNYEAIDAGSVFAGVNFNFGTELTLEATPMLGGVFGSTNGVAPGYRLTLGFKQFELYTEGEYLFDLDDSSESFFYSWSELSYYPTDWLRIGLVGQRTRVYETDLDFQRGFLVGFSYRNVDVTTYVFNLGWEDPTLVFSIALKF